MVLPINRFCARSVDAGRRAHPSRAAFFRRWRVPGVRIPLLLAIAARLTGNAARPTSTKTDMARELIQRLAAHLHSPIIAPKCLPQQLKTMQQEIAGEEPSCCPRHWSGVDVANWFGIMSEAERPPQDTSYVSQTSIALETI